VNRSRYWEAPDGRHFNYDVEPTFHCPNAAGIAGPAVAVAAEALGADAEPLARIIERAHGSHRYGRVRDANGRLTDRCTICGARMERKGFRCWIDEPNTADESGARIASRLGFEPPRQTIRVVWLDTKREAREWCYEEFQLAKSVDAS
jgi:hypothetical protein